MNENLAKLKKGVLKNMTDIKKVTYTNNQSGLMTIPKKFLDKMNSPEFFRLEFDGKNTITLKKLECGKNEIR